MKRPAFAAPALLLLLAACASEDPRLPQQLYEEAVKLSRDGKLLEAKALMDQIISRYPESTAAGKARDDGFRLELSIKQDQQERQRLLKASIRRATDALERYRAKNGEYPASLNALVPDFIEQAPATPWGHPFFYRPFVANPIEDVRDRRGNISQRFNTKRDRYHLACLGIDLKPGGTDLAADTLVVNGEVHKEATFPPIPGPQPVR